MAHLLDDEYLKPFENAIRGRAQRAEERAQELTQGKCSLADWANAHNYYGLHKERIVRMGLPRMGAACDPDVACRRLQRLEDRS